MDFAGHIYIYSSIHTCPYKHVCNHDSQRKRGNLKIRRHLVGFWKLVALSAANHLSKMLLYKREKPPLEPFPMHLFYQCSHLAKGGPLHGITWYLYAMGADGWGVGCPKVSRESQGSVHPNPGVRNKQSAKQVAYLLFFFRRKRTWVDPPHRWDRRSSEKRCLLRQELCLKTAC